MLSKQLFQEPSQFLSQNVYNSIRELPIRLDSCICILSSSISCAGTQHQQEQNILLLYKQHIVAGSLHISQERPSHIAQMEHRGNLPKWLQNVSAEVLHIWAKIPELFCRTKWLIPTPPSMLLHMDVYMWFIIGNSQSTQNAENEHG